MSFVTFYVEITVDPEECEAASPRGAYDMLSAHLESLDLEVIGFSIPEYQIDDGPKRTTDALSVCPACTAAGPDHTCGAENGR